MPIDMKIVEAQAKTGKRFTAIFRIHKGGKVIKITHFGQRNPKQGTYIDHGDKKKRTAFRARHKKDLETKDFKRAGYLSYFLLWGDSTSLKQNIEDYKKKFNLT
tara:strand:+ start:3535 stop:3846 length:312 start_codon:yes stop_codon:yes gene_type:complete